MKTRNRAISDGETNERLSIAAIRARNDQIVSRGRPRIGVIFLIMIVLNVCYFTWLAHGGSW